MPKKTQLFHALRPLACLLVVFVCCSCAHQRAGAAPMRIGDIPHAQSFAEDVHFAVAQAQQRGARLRGRLLAIPSSMRLSYTGGQKNFNFLTIGAAHLGMDVSAITKEGEISSYFPSQGVRALPFETLYVDAADIGALQDRLTTLKEALGHWRLHRKDAAAKEETLRAFAQAAQLLLREDTRHRSPNPEAYKPALDVLGDESPLHDPLELLVFGTRARFAADLVHPDVCFVDLTHEALAVVLADIGRHARIVWYVQNAGEEPDNALLAREVDVFACSDSALTQKFGDADFARATRVVRNGIALQRFEASAPEGTSLKKTFELPSDAYLIGQLGALLSNKDQKLAVEALSVVQKAVPHAYLVLIGGLLDRAYVAEIKERAAQLGIAEHVLFLGERDDVPALLKQLDVSISASHNEGFGMSVAEAMAAGTPLVLSRILPSEMLAGDAALYFPVGDAQRLATQLLALSDAERRAQMRKAVRARAQTYVASQSDMLVSFADALGRLEVDAH